MKEIVIELENIRKSYGNVKAVDGISLRVNKGEVLGIIGANGAGKSTTLEIMMGLRTPESGSVKVLGLDIMDGSYEIKQKIGIQLQQTALYDRIKVKEALELFSSYYDKKRDLQEIIQALGLEPYLNKYVKNLSGGWQQRTSLALALVNDPEIIFLDEPTTGLDPQARLELWNCINRFRAEGKTIILSTHYMDEAQRHCDRIAIIKKGHLVACDQPKNLINSLLDGEGSMEDVYLQYAVGV
ncbi:ABC transporter ATP-binding protein [Pseudoneobacillus rhizosphaerae]|jgi:ABC-2 type transport system ATP-binding protein|uniref:Multidrug ABC transporter ATP-binding protein YbhF n=1 Tax=Pseudoneobacillus rhizosphaerae TaxID=2880968 RepID=A0A9C7GDM2_9BACI|nr:ABC transporter ATP-binding protein [Pseudoneobacillus rhizosphaerae]CAG9610240.1 putative multidrug ABC transporter ATP-binding protein YbhF [Pseudoneobacillus rhizosphaerae]